MDNERLTIETNETEKDVTEVTKEKEKKKSMNILKLTKKAKRTAIGIVCLVILLVILDLFTPFKLLKWVGIEKLFIGEEGKNTVVTEVSLEKMVEIGELHTAEYIHNSIATSYDERGKVKYYVTYEGRVSAGIDFNEVDFNVDEENKLVTCIIPKAEILNMEVDATTLEFIFRNNKYDTENINQEAYPLCKEDLENKIQNENEILQEADKNAQIIIEALTDPLIKELGYEVNYEYKEN